MPEELSRDRVLIPLYDLVVVIGLNDRGAIWIGYDQRDNGIRTYLIMRKIWFPWRNMPNNPSALTRILCGLKLRYQERKQTIRIRAIDQSASYKTNKGMEMTNTWLFRSYSQKLNSISKPHLMALSVHWDVLLFIPVLSIHRDYAAHDMNLSTQCVFKVHWTHRSCFPGTTALYDPEISWTSWEASAPIQF